MATSSEAAVATWPRSECCARCGAGVLIAPGYGRGRPYRLEPLPILPLGRCGRCRGRGTIEIAAPRRGGLFRTFEPGDLFGQTRVERTDCPVCGGSGQSGEAIVAAEMVLVDSLTGRARRGETRRSGEAFHRRHRCSGAG